MQVLYEKSDLDLVVLLTAITSALGSAIIIPVFIQQSAEAARDPIFFRDSPKTPVAVSGDNIYIVWWTNKTENDEIMLRVSNDAGATFGESTTFRRLKIS